MKSSRIYTISKYGLYRWIHFLLRKTISKNGIDAENIVKIVCASEKLKDYKTSSEFLFSVEKAKDYLKSNDTSMIVQTADAICQHRFRILGDKEVGFGERINWLQDYKSGFVWCKPEEDNRDSGTDVKRIWDLSRFYQMPILGKAYLATDNIKYYEEFSQELMSWVEQNPFAKTINWKCSMEIAIRAVNLICATYLFEDIIDETTRTIINQQVMLSGFYIRNNLEDDCLTPNNHFISDLVGLIFISIYFRDLKGELGSSCDLWLRYACQLIQKEIKREICADGVSYEKSTAYHSYVTELLLYTMMVLKANGYEIKSKSLEIVECMVEFCLSISGDGKMPLFGDQDDSRLLRLDNHYPHENILKTGYLKKGLSNLKEKKYDEVDWLFESSDIVYTSSMVCQFPKAGYYVLRNELIQVDVICGELSCLGTGGHSHNDQLSFIIYYKGIPVTTDPGTYCYTESEKDRNYFRSTNNHSTVCVEHSEQNVFKKGKYFRLDDMTRSKCVRVTNDLFEGKHFGYIDRYDVTHRRSINIVNNEVNVLDELDGNKKAFATSNIILQVGAIQTGERMFRVNNVDLELIVDERSSLQIEKVWVSSRYGEKEETIKISIPFTFKTQYSIRVGGKR